MPEGPLPSSPGQPQGPVLLTAVPSPWLAQPATRAPGLPLQWGRGAVDRCPHGQSQPGWWELCVRTGAPKAGALKPGPGVTPRGMLSVAFS